MLDYQIPIFNEKYIFKGSIFHCYVRLPEGKVFFFLTEKPQVCGLWNPPKLLKKDAAVLSKELQSRAGLSWRHPFHVSSGQNHGWLFDIGDYTTQYLCGDYNKPI